MIPVIFPTLVKSLLFTTRGRVVYSIMKGDLSPVQATQQRRADSNQPDGANLA